MLLIFFFLSCSSFNIVDLNSLSDTYDLQVFYATNYIGCLFGLLIVSFAAKRFKVRCSPICLLFLSLPVLLAPYPRNSCCVQYQEDFPLCFFYFCKKCFWNFERDCVRSADDFEYNGCLNNVVFQSINPKFFSCICVLFNTFQQYFVFFSVLMFCFLAKSYFGVYFCFDALVNGIVFLISFLVHFSV